jgi:hypothetical protein
MEFCIETAVNAAIFDPRVAQPESKTITDSPDIRHNYFVHPFTINNLTGIEVAENTAKRR